MLSVLQPLNSLSLPLLSRMLQAMLLTEPLITIADLQIDDDQDEEEDYLMLLRMYAMHNCCAY